MTQWGNPMANEEKGSWPDLAPQGMKMSLHTEVVSAQDGTKTNIRRVVISSLHGELPERVSSRLADIGFEPMLLDGKLVQTKSGKLPAPDLQRALQYGTSTLPKGADYRIQGKIEPYVAPEAEVDMATADLSAIMSVDLDAKPAEPTPAPQEAPKAAEKAAEKAVEKPVAPPKAAAAPKEQPAKAPAVPQQKHPRPAKAKLADPSELEARAGWEALADLSDFRNFLVYEGLPADARDEFVAAMQVMRAHFDFDEIFVAKHDDPKKAFGAKLRERFLKETPYKNLATMRIIDCVYPFAKEFLSRTPAQKEEYKVFAESCADKVEEAYNLTVETAEDFHVRARQANGGKEISCFNSSFLRNIRMTGIRILMDLVAAEDQMPIFRELREKDARFSELVGKQPQNYMSPVITKLRGDEKAVSIMKEKRAEVFGDVAPQPAPAP
jgi:hypothetical protein